MSIAFAGEDVVVCAILFSGTVPCVDQSDCLVALTNGRAPRPTVRWRLGHECDARGLCSETPYSHVIDSSVLWLKPI